MIRDCLIPQSFSNRLRTITVGLIKIANSEKAWKAFPVREVMRNKCIMTIVYYKENKGTE